MQEIIVNLTNSQHLTKEIIFVGNRFRFTDVNTNSPVTGVTDDILSICGKPEAS